MEKQVKIAAKLYECRDTAKRFYKDEFTEKIKPYSEILEKVKKAKGIDTLQSALKIASLESMKEDGFGTMMLFAATVEMLEPSGA